MKELYLTLIDIILSEERDILKEKRRHNFPGPAFPVKYLLIPEIKTKLSTAARKTVTGRESIPVPDIRLTFMAVTDKFNLASNLIFF